ncbi:MAG TPA: hypothetical protein VG942_15785 [Hyphomonadaceae bacterium]|nr:hypothetical protein [Hyphomonadaceae bacterium]
MPSASLRSASWAGLGLVSGLGMALAAFLLIAPDVGPPPLFPFQDKVFHFICFGCLAGPAVLVLPRQYMWFWLAHMAALGAGIEVAQGLGHNGRDAELSDFLADLAGILAAWGIGRLIRARVEVPSP